MVISDIYACLYVCVCVRSGYELMGGVVFFFIVKRSHDIIAYLPIFRPSRSKYRGYLAFEPIYISPFPSKMRFGIKTLIYRTGRVKTLRYIGDNNI